jgi:ADP-ribose pyrophosphatase YjhB (NUDIX family)
MNGKEAVEVVHNGWRAFVVGLAPWTDDIVHWAVSLADRRPFPVLWDKDARRFSHSDGRPLLPLEADFVLPISALTPPLPDRPVFRNPPAVAVALVPTRKGLVAIRRALAGLGEGMIALPGGYQEFGETLREAAARELFQETGVRVDPADLELFGTDTVEGGTVNLVFFRHKGVVEAPEFVHDDEVLEVLEIEGPVETGFPAHSAMVARHFASLDG